MHSAMGESCEFDASGAQSSRAGVEAGRVERALAACIPAVGAFVAMAAAEGSGCAAGCGYWWNRDEASDAPVRDGVSNRAVKGQMVAVSRANEHAPGSGAPESGFGCRAFVVGERAGSVEVGSSPVSNGRAAAATVRDCGLVIPRERLPRWPWCWRGTLPAEADGALPATESPCNAC